MLLFFKDGSCIIYTLHDAKFLHSFKPFGEVQNCLISIRNINITDNGDIIIFAVNHTKVKQKKNLNILKH